jgi:REP element-mobilizing transposase RayT
LNKTKEQGVKKKCTRRTTAPRQQELAFPLHGGARKGAGRKPKGRAAGPSHAARTSTPSRHPLLVTQKFCAGLPRLRQEVEFAVLRGAFADAARRDGFRVVHLSVQSNHIHYICEARDVRSLTSGMRSLGVMIARRLNRLWQRSGQVFAERFHARALATPNEVRQALTYVLNNAQKHGIIGDGADPFSSGASFDGWKPEAARPNSSVRQTQKHSPAPVPLAAAETWLLRVGWRQRGLIGLREVPGGEAARRARQREEARCADLIQRSLAAAARNSPQRRMERCAHGSGIPYSDARPH